MPAIGLPRAVRGGEGCVDMARVRRLKLEFPRRLMKLEHGVPSRDAFSDLFNALGPGGLRDALPVLASGRGELLKDDSVAVDGKALRRSFKDAAATAFRCRRATGEKPSDVVRFHFADPDNAEKILFCSDLDKDRGRIELREATVCHDVQTLRDPRRRPGLEAAGRAEATREIEGERETGTRFFLLGSKMAPERFPGAVRARRAVENSLAGRSAQQ